MANTKLFRLQWQSHQSTHMQHFSELLKCGTLFDCTLAAEGRCRKAHKLILSACSPFFKELFSEHYDKHPIVVLKDIKFKEMEALMLYMYKGEVTIPEDEVIGFLTAATSLQIKIPSSMKTEDVSRIPNNSRQQEQRTTTRVMPQSFKSNDKVCTQCSNQNSANPGAPVEVLSRKVSHYAATETRDIHSRSIAENSVPNDSNSRNLQHQTIASSGGVSPIATQKIDNYSTKSYSGRVSKHQSSEYGPQLPPEKSKSTDILIEPKSECPEENDGSFVNSTLSDNIREIDQTGNELNRAGSSNNRSNVRSIGSTRVPETADKYDPEFSDNSEISEEPFSRTKKRKRLDGRKSVTGDNSAENHYSSDSSYRGENEESDEDPSGIGKEKKKAGRDAEGVKRKALDRFNDVRPLFFLCARGYKCFDCNFNIRSMRDLWNHSNHNWDRAKRFDSELR